MVPGPERTLMLCTSSNTFMQNLSVSKVCLVGDAVDVGLVGVMVCVCVDVGEVVTVNVRVGDSVGVAGSRVLVGGVVGGRGVSVRVVTGFGEKVNAKASRRMIPRMVIGIAYLRSALERDDVGFSRGKTTGPPV